MEKKITVGHLPVTRTARYYRVGTLGAMTRDVWIACHGYGQLAAQFVDVFRPVVGEACCVIAPEALSRFYLEAGSRTHTVESPVGASWMTREDRDMEIEDTVAYLDAVYEQLLSELATHEIARDGVRVHALGFSQGCAAVSRWVARGSAVVDHLVVWGSGIPDDVNLRSVHERHSGFAVDMVYGSRDTFVTAQRLAMQETMLRAAGVPYGVYTFDGGHTLNKELLGQLLKG